MDRGFEQIFFQRRHTDGQQAHEKMLNITNDQGNANQNCNEIPPHACQNSYHQKGPEITRRCGEKGTLLHCWRECKLVQPLWKSVWRFLEKVKMEIVYDPATPLLGTYQKNKNTNSKRHMHPSVHSSIIYNCQDMETT